MKQTKTKITPEKKADNHQREKSGNRQKEVTRTINIFTSQLIKNNDCLHAFENFD